MPESSIWLHKSVTVIAHICPHHGQKIRNPQSGAWRCRHPRPPFNWRNWYENGGREMILAAAKRNPNTSEHRKRAKAKRRGANRGFWVTRRDRRRALARQEGLCFWCRARPPTDWDHVFPVSRGGVHSIGNLVLACSPCNTSKAAKLLIQWAGRPQMV